MDRVAVRDSHHRDRDIFQAEGPVAFFAEEMDVEVIVLAVVVAVAELVADAAAGIFKNMDKMGFAEHLQGAEDSALVYGFKGVFKLHHSQRPMRVVQGPGYEQPVGRGLYSVFLKQLFHYPNSSSINSLQWPGRIM